MRHSRSIQLLEDSCSIGVDLGEFSRVVGFEFFQRAGPFASLHCHLVLLFFVVLVASSERNVALEN